LRTAGEGARPELGQTFKLTPDQRTERIRRRDRGETLSDIVRSYNVHPSTIYGSPLKLKATLVWPGSLNTVVPLRPDLPEIDTSLDRHGLCPSRRSELSNDAVDGTTATADYKHVLYYPA
jgi:hypothetical protein